VSGFGRKYIRRETSEELRNEDGQIDSSTALKRAATSADRVVVENFVSVAFSSTCGC